jgi:hypothetical protein
MDFLNPSSAAVDPVKQKDLQAQWKGWASDPKAQAFLLNTGLQLMMPSWYGGGTSIAQAVGKGLEGAGGIEKMQLAEAEKLRGEGRSFGDRDANREDQQAHDVELELLKQSGRADLLESRTGSDGGGFTKEERQVADREYKRRKAALEKANADPLAETVLSADEIDAQARAAARDAVGAKRSAYETKATSANSAAGTGPVGQEGGDLAPNPTRPISQTGPARTQNSLKTPGRSAATISTQKKPLTPELLADPSINDPAFRSFLKDRGYDIE